MRAGPLKCASLRLSTQASQRMRNPRFSGIPRGALTRRWNFVIEAVDGPLAPAIVDARLAGPFERGLHAMPLAKFGAQLEVGREYAWRIAVVVDEKRRANDVFAGANIARAAHSKSLRETLNAATPSDHPKIYASAGLWYDALTSIDALRSTAGQRTRAVANCRDMLDGQALNDVSCD